MITNLDEIYRDADDLGRRIAELEQPSGRMLVAGEVFRRIRLEAALHPRNVRERVMQQYADARLRELLRPW